MSVFKVGDFVEYQDDVRISVHGEKGVWVVIGVDYSEGYFPHNTFYRTRPVFPLPSVHHRDIVFPENVLKLWSE